MGLNACVVEDFTNIEVICRNTPRLRTRSQMLVRRKDRTHVGRSVDLA